MVHGMRARSSRSSSTVQSNYLVNIQEIRPWPPSQSLKSLRSALIQWENGEKSSGTTSTVIPTIGSASEEGKIEFNESFKLSVILTREIGKAGDQEAFQKNCLEFNLYEPRRDKTVKGQLLGSAIVNLADYGVIKNTVRLNAPVNCTRSFKNSAQPILYFEIQPLRKGPKNFSSEETLSRRMSMDRIDLESISSMTKEEYNERAEIASFTDDDISSHSSATITNSSSSGDHTPENDESSYDNLKDGNVVLENDGNLVHGQEQSGGAVVNGPAPEIDALRDEKLRPVSRAGITVRKESIAPVQLHTDFRATNGSAKHFKEISISSDSKIDKLQEKVKMLEEELREAAAAEVSLYAIVAEHGSSMNKLHAPARRLSRLYLHACKDGSRTGMSRAAKSAASGLVLVAKACGNDVPRLTFWLSNCVMLRAIISQGSENSKLPPSARAINAKVTSSEPSSRIQKNGNAFCRSSDDCMDTEAFLSALEKIEAWIFSRVVESIWWQTLTPHMQSSAAKEIDVSKPGKSFSKMPSSDGRDQGNFSLVLWKKAFTDACERLCPIRAAGHECGCLPVLAKLVMEQCVARLDVAMFNAILRESDDDIPTDPVSDPISDPRVLPILAGKSCFGAGVQLKNVIGNWSRLFSEVFGIDEDDSIADEGEQSSISDRQDLSLRSFNLLNALSDLLMLPKDMLISKSIRQEICPAFGAQLIKRVLDTYVPDEFCPEPVPVEVLQALEADEDISEDGEVCFTNFPCTASPPTYLPPSAASLACYIGETGNPHLTRTTSSVLRKSYTSDDELDEIDSPLNSISLEGANSPSMASKSSHSRNGAENAVRYHLLREVWKDSV